MKYDLAEHWNKLKESLLQYEKEYQQMPFENVDDKIAYNSAKEMLEEMVQLGIDMENAIWPLTKIKLGQEIDGLNAKRFGTEEIPTIRGNKSLHFVQQVFLPHLKRSLEIEYSPLVNMLSKKIGINLDEKSNKAIALVDKLERAVKNHIENHSKLLDQSLFAAKIENEQKLDILQSVNSHLAETTIINR